MTDSLSLHPPPAMLAAGLPVNLPTDPHLLGRAFVDGDEEAWAQLVREYTPMIRRFAHSIGWYEQHLDDLIQEVWRTLLQKRGEFRYDPRGKFRNYLFTVVRNTAFALGRKIQRAGAENGHSALLESLAREDPALSEAWDQQWENWHREQAFAWVSQQTNPSHWQVFLELMIDRMDSKEVATRHGISVDNVYKIKQRILDAIKERIRAQLDGEERPQ